MKMLARKSDLPKFSAAERRNWGFWDGDSDRKTNRRPAWVNPGVYRCRHPFDQSYAAGYWAGFYGEAHPNTGETAVVMMARAV